MCYNLPLYLIIQQKTNCYFKKAQTCLQGHYKDWMIKMLPPFLNVYRETIEYRFENKILIVLVIISLL